MINTVIEVGEEVTVLMEGVTIIGTTIKEATRTVTGGMVVTGTVGMMGRAITAIEGNMKLIVVRTLEMTNPRMIEHTGVGVGVGTGAVVGTRNHTIQNAQHLHRLH